MQFYLRNSIFSFPEIETETEGIRMAASSHEQNFVVENAFLCNRVASCDISDIDGRVKQPRHSTTATSDMV